jgi:hypothetical protein
MYTTALSLGLALALLSSCAVATPIPQVVFRDAHHVEQKPLVYTNAGTILDVLAERPEFSKLLELIEKDKGEDMNMAIFTCNDLSTYLPV